MDTPTGIARYEIGEKVAESEAYRLYFCTDTTSSRQCLFQIAATVANNGDLDRAAFVLGELSRRADELEKEWAPKKPAPNHFLNYNLTFPELVDSFVCPEQGDRRVNILAFRGVENVSKMVPVSGITAKDGLRVDLRTSGWIMGKLLKLLVFTHGEGILINKLSGSNILIEPDQHYVLVFDWSATTIDHQGEISEDDRRQEISEAAKAVITVLGGDPETGEIPNDGEAYFGQYAERLRQLAEGDERDAVRAHQRFYELIDGLWERGFYPFTAKPLSH